MILAVIGRAAPLRVENNAVVIRVYGMAGRIRFSDSVTVSDGDSWGLWSFFGLAVSASDLEIPLIRIRPSWTFRHFDIIHMYVPFECSSALAYSTGVKLKLVLQGWSG